MSHPRTRHQVRLKFYAPFNWRAAVWASVIAGLAFTLLDIGLAWAVRGVSPWMPLRMIGAIVLGPAALSPPDAFDAEVVLVALLLHFMLSIAYGTFLAFLIPAIDSLWTIIVGGVYGLALYYLNFYGFNAFSPWFAEQRDWVSVASHFAFGAVAAYAYKSISTPLSTAHAE